MEKINKFSVLIVTKDMEMAKVLKTYWENAWFWLHIVSSGEEALQVLTTWKPDLILIDIELPDWDGCEVIKQIKVNMDVPVIAVSKSDKESERTKALAAGADDYFRKPFNCREISERAKSILGLENNEVKSGDTLQAGGLTINLGNFQVRYKGHDIVVTLTEFKILGVLVSHSEQTLNRDEIINMIWGKNLKRPTRAIDVHIHSLRRKLKDIGEYDYIQTVHGVGYRFACNNKLSDPVPDTLAPVQ